MVTVIYWYATERAGAGNVIPYARLPGLVHRWSSCCCCWPFRRGATRHGGLLAWAAVWYGLAKVFETFDLQVYRLLGGTLSGHTIKHVLASFAVFAIVRQLRLRSRTQNPGPHERPRQKPSLEPDFDPSGLRRPRRSSARTCAASSARPSRTTA